MHDQSSAEWMAVQVVQSQHVHLQLTYHLVAGSKLECYLFGHPVLKVQ